MEELLCSVIIPAYNAGKCIDGCLKSLDLDGCYAYNLEVLVIDDGSKDDTAQIVNKWSEEFPCVKLIQKENGGVSSARNLGLEKACGKYIFFADSDDEVKRKALDEMIDVATKTGVDMVIADYLQRTLLQNGEQKEEYVSCLIQEGLHGAKYIEEVILKRIFKHESDGLTTLWNKLFKKELIKSNLILFDPKMTYGEDLSFNIECFLKAKALYGLQKPVYAYNTEERNYNHFIRYRKGVGYSLIYMHATLLRLNAENFHYEKESNEYLGLMRSFAYGSLKYLSLKACSDKEKKEFLKTKEQKELWGYLLGLNKEKLFEAGYSRRNKLAFFLLKLGRWKLALKLLGRTEE